ncbi:MAG: ankyrin repeat domain-containing protein [Kiritimatiellia bacterium]|jgi:hypothetical protein
MKMILMMSVVSMATLASGEETPRTLFDAIKSDDLSEVRQMAVSREHVNARDAQNFTPLMVASRQASVETVKILVEAGADIDAKVDGFTVIDQVESYLRRTGDNKKRTIEMMKRDGFSEQLIKAVEEDARGLNESPERIQKWQTILDYLKEVKDCARADNNPATNDMPFDGGETVLSVDTAAKSILDAVRNGNLHEVKQMVRDKALLDKRDAHGRSPLMLAAEQGNVEITKVLIEAGADVNARDRFGFTAVDLIESILRRVHFNSPEFLRERAERMRREGFSEDVVEKELKLLKGSAVPGPQRTANDIQNLEEVLRCLKKAVETRTEDAGGQNGK